MTPIRAVYRTMLASYFVSSGFKAVRNPAPLAPLAEPVADKVVPFVKKYAPEQVSGFIPEDTETLVRINGALQLVGGLALATGKGRRVGALLLAGSLIPSTLAKYPFWSQSGDEKALSKTHFAKNISLLGGVLLASRDTEGKPGLAWRAQAGGHAIAKSTERATRKLTHSSSGTGDAIAKQAHKAADLVKDKAGDLTDVVSDKAPQVADRGSDLASAALAGGVALLGAAEVRTRKARKQARKQFKQTQAQVLKQAKEAQVELAKRAEEAREQAAKAAKQAKKDGGKALKQGKKDAVKAAKQAKVDAAAAAKQAVKDGKKQAQVAKKTASKKLDKVGRHIELGEN